MPTSPVSLRTTWSVSIPSISPPRAPFDRSRVSGPSSQFCMKIPANPIAALPACHSLAHPQNLSGSIRAGNARQLHPGVVFARHHQQIAVIQRNCAHPQNQHFSGARGQAFCRSTNSKESMPKRRYLPGAHGPCLQLFPQAPFIPRDARPKKHS